MSLSIDCHTQREKELKAHPTGVPDAPEPCISDGKAKRPPISLQGLVVKFPAPSGSEPARPARVNAEAGVPRRTTNFVMPLAGVCEVAPRHVERKPEGLAAGKPTAAPKYVLQRRSTAAVIVDER
jgi:hypothetical protein